MAAFFPQRFTVTLALTTPEFVCKARARHGDKYDYSDVQYLTAKQYVTIICPIHGPFQQQPTDHLSNGGCRTCGIERRTELWRSNRDDFIKRARQIHGNRYAYDRVSYVKMIRHVEIICQTHGVFKQTPLDHLYGRGCRKCGIVRRATNQSLAVEGFIIKARKVHGDLYDYSHVKYTNNNTDVVIVCHLHGPFEQWPANHLYGKGCPQCAANRRGIARRLSLDEFIRRAKEMHGDRFDYTNVEYINTVTKISIVCPAHGPFKQKPGDHFGGQGCPTCFFAFGVSKACTLWLNDLQVPKREFFLTVGLRRIRVDGFDPITNTVYEFHGDIWHGNPNRFDPDDRNPLNRETFGSLYRKTIRRDQDIIDAGYNLVVVWESDWKAGHAC